ncbi:arginine biosynthesis bifunctional protein ArgJ [Phaeobacter piscinae]|uniref:Arginine biosynthesis bifunctional protein ArgJ n=1 Tax=Phaeobacter piscinae TaxID=1580596 RepID=A0ABM6PI01_9RHOB|nr:bifunctional glutamate N-acetyltransferase/amino-acid acetyltransferase ArgJ [Phaeobacter piscinae]ATG37369.1 arginine biosynthesis bifunctional protein ArgJ [Phaeobacter piscinae]AUQ87890.1 arginine biosynthesis bifunctional protein ArgJ [Phaeobacter piscinae]AUR25773.1 arginine biosynthesis bifunctional protein ArgJ [Phaeobacter piscinae]UTS82312.1 Arginine biosynthesis bifunctional protein ArgJ [Phaeobacter piscinae]
MALPRSPLAPDHFPTLPQIAGVRFASAAAGVKYKDRTDVMLAVMDPGSAVAGVFTRSATRSAPVLDCQAKLASSDNDTAHGAAILVNSGNSNAFTGHYGQTSVAEITRTVADITGIPTARVFTASTGVIGEPLPHERIVSQIATLNDGLDGSAIEGAAEAIMTTDTFAKGAGATVEVDGKTVSIAGIAKGSGMIAPDMATMLVYIFTDAKIAQEDLQALLSQICDRTFNCITVDSDTSTSDSLMLCASGAAGVDVTGNADFALALEGVMLDLSHQVVRDGEGATKFVEIQVTGAMNDHDAKVHGLSIANSPLVKTAIAGEDPNWGRVVMAIGKSGAAADRDKLSISFGEVLVAEKGWVSPDYKEADGAAEMAKTEIVIKVDLGLAEGKSTVWTCDLTHQYISINADYRS